jgi:dipeptidyl aminopeptidase/acylaminoacyl peptidase
MLSALRVCKKTRRQGGAALLFLFTGMGIPPMLVSQGKAPQEQPAIAKSVARGVQGRKRLLTEEDAIQMVRIAGHEAISEYAGTLTKDFAYFAPDHKQFAIILKKGNLETNTNDYSLLVFKTDQVFDFPKPRVLVSMSSSSNREGITDVFWLSDNDTLLFLGQNPSETMQLYSVSSSSGAIRKLTHHPTNLIAFTSDPSGKSVVCTAEQRTSPVVTDKNIRQGIAVAREDMSDLLAGEVHSRALDLLFVDGKTGATRPLPLEDVLRGAVWGDVHDMALSPDGRELVVKINLTNVPQSWHEYRDGIIARLFQRRPPNGSLSWIYRYALIDIETGHGKVLLDAPVGYHGSELMWSADSRSMIVSGVFLPLGDSRMNPELMGHPSVVEVNFPTLGYSTVASQDLALRAWDQEKNLLKFETRPTRDSAKSPELLCLRKRDGRWEPVDVASEPDLSLKVLTEQDPSTPPKVVVSDPKMGRNAILLDLNPQMKEVELGRVEEITFTGADHLEVHAGLYFPPDYVAGNKYPLIVQTHGFDGKSFWVDGSFTTAYAAQALASHGMLVLQVPDLHAWDGTPDEAPKMMETLERAIEYVDHLDVLDRGHVGIVGFSRPGLYVYYILTHSRMHFEAAVVADGSDGSYSQYVQFLSAYPSTAADSEGLNGGAPFGSGLLFWLRRSPEFLLDRVTTPLMVQAASRASLSTQWAEFVGLRRLGKPTELLYFPAGVHVLEKPWDRLASQQGTVDWCVFWLKGEKDPNPSKADKYARWETMRASSSNDGSNLN